MRHAPHDGEKTEVNMVKKLYRSTKNRMISGVCGGIGERLGIDPTIIRLIWVVASFLLTAVIGGILIYFVCALIIPTDPGYTDI